MSEFIGQKAIVTGATRGIGKAITLALLEQGATVIGVYGANEKAAQAFREEAVEYADRLWLLQCDVADYDQVVGLYAKIEERFDMVDILVSNAGIRRDGVLAMLSPADWNRVIDVNLNGTFNMAKHAVLLMLKQKYGRIVFMTSPMARQGFAGVGNYAASKAGQIGLMGALAKETARRNITVNCVSPGFIETELLGDIPAEQLKEYKSMIPARRFGTTGEVAHAVLFLCGRKAGYITGSVLEVTGGL